MSMERSIHERLRHLNIGRGVGQIKPQPRRQPGGIEDLVGGEVISTPHGPFFLRRQVYDRDHRHGNALLADLLEQPLPAAVLARDRRLLSVEPEGLAFLDAETTGLAGGTGTYCFLVGVGCFEAGSFVLYQFFMRDLHEEEAQFYALGTLLERLSGVVSFNGRSFDLPLLEARFELMRQPPPRLVGAPHLDLLAPARRIWKHRLDSCALSRLEQEVLGVARSAADIPGYLIPDIYRAYLDSGDATQLSGVFDHNADDILSLVTLAIRFNALLAGPEGMPDGLPGEDVYGLAGLVLELGQVDRAKALYARAAGTCRSRSVRESAMRDLAYLLKREERRAEALAWWLELADGGAVYACEELAKHYEWRDADLPQAVDWTRRAIAFAEQWPRSPRRRETLAELRHRLDRLTVKLKA